MRGDERRCKQFDVIDNGRTDGRMDGWMDVIWIDDMTRV